MRWKNLGENQVVGTPWFELKLAEVELPGGRRLDHYLMRLPPVVLTAVLDPDGRTHRVDPARQGARSHR